MSRCARNKKRMSKVLVLTYWSFRDALVQTYTLPYVKLIAQQTQQPVWLLTLEQEQLAMSAEQRAAAEKELAGHGIRLVTLPYLPFGVKAMLAWRSHLKKLRALIRSENIDTLHAWCTPAGAIAWMLARKTPCRLIIDSFEPHAEAMVENGTWKKSGAAFRILFNLEKRQAARADALIGLTPHMQQYAEKKYGVSSKNFFVKPALIDFSALPAISETQKENLRNELRLRDHVTCIYAGKTGGIYLERELFDLFKAGEERWGEKFAVLLLSATPAEKLERLAAASGLDKKKLRIRFVPQQDVYAYMSLADFAVNPVKPVPSKRCCTSIKDGEYWAMGLPVIIPPGISDDSDIIAQNGTGVIWDDLSPEGCRAAIGKMDRLLHGDRAELSARVRRQAQQHRDFRLAEEIYARIYGKA